MNQETKQLTAQQLALYFGQQAEISVKLPGDQEPQQRTPRPIDGELLYDLYLAGRDYPDTGFIIKPVLRRLASITQEEMNHVGLTLKAGTANAPMLKWEHISPFTCIRLTPEIFEYLLFRGFDLFKWIDQGLAIDKTKTTN